MGVESGRAQSRFELAAVRTRRLIASRSLPSGNQWRTVTSVGQAFPPRLRARNDPVPVMYAGKSAPPEAASCDGSSRFAPEKIESSDAVELQFDWYMLAS